MADRERKDRIQVLWAAPWVTAALIPGGGLMFDCLRCMTHRELGVDGCPRELFTLLEQLRTFHLNHARCPALPAAAKGQETPA